MPNRMMVKESDDHMQYLFGQDSMQCMDGLFTDKMYVGTANEHYFVCMNENYFGTVSSF